MTDKCFKIWLITLLLVLVVGSVMQPCAPPAAAQEPTDEGAEPFAPFQEPPVEVEAQVAHEPIAPDLANVEVPFALTAAQQERLGQIGFVVSPGREKEFFTVYEKSRYNYEPIFVTSDSLLHVYHLMFDKILRSAEIKYFIPLLGEMNAALVAQAEANYQALKGTPWEEAARRTVAYFVVPAKVLDDEVTVPAYAADLVEGELKNIEEAADILPSPIFPGLISGEDYTQYIPRGHYTRTEDLERYFKAMMWYGRMTFRLTTDDPEVGRAETRLALLVCHTLRSVTVGRLSGLEAWNDLYAPTVFFVGRSDDLTVLQYLSVMDEIYGPQADLLTIADDARLDAFIEEANKLPPPQILGMVIFFTDEVEETTKGLRFMGQRFVPDAFIFRQLIFRNVSTPGHRRGLPKGLDVFAALGSERAYALLDELEETAYDKYPEQMKKVRDIMAGYSEEQWTETLYNTWIHTLKPLLDVPGAPLWETGGQGYPEFMQNESWLDKSLNTALGSWAELKHDTILYAKQVYAEMGGGGGGKGPPPAPQPPKGYVEPNPHFFARLWALATLTREGLAARNLLSDRDADNLTQIESLALALKRMAEKELRNEPLTDDEYDLIRFYGGRLEHITMAASLDEADEEYYGPPVMDEEPQAAVIADVATDPDHDFDGIPSPAVLEVGVGRIDEIYVAAPVEGKLQVVKGGVFSYYEFPHPARDRLTDEKWRGMLDAGQAPPREPWTDSFIVEETIERELAVTVRRFLTRYVDAIWWPDEGGIQYWAKGEAADKVVAEVEALDAAGQYEGRQLIQLDFRSFDLESDTVAIVTVRETWDARLYEQGPEEIEAPVLMQRGPYTIDVTYTLERAPDSSQWVTSNMVWNTQPPAWETL